MNNYLRRFMEDNNFRLDEELKTDDHSAELKEFETLIRPLIKFLNDGHNPHTSIVVTQTSAKLLSDEMSIYTEDYIVD